MSSTKPLASTSAVGELYESLLSSRRRARQRLQTVQDIEQRRPLTGYTF